MKKLIIATLLSIISVTVMAYDFKAIGPGGKELCYTIVSMENKTVELAAGEPDGSTYTGSVIIPAYVNFNDIIWTVIGIGPKAMRCPGLEQVVVPETVTYIGYKAFCKCPMLSYIQLPSSIRKIAYRALDNLPNLSTIYIKNPDPSTITVENGNDFTLYSNSVVTVQVPPAAVMKYARTQPWANARVESF